MTPEQLFKNEFANSITHGIGAILALVGVALLLPMTVQTGSALAMFCGAVFGASLLQQYIASTLYHSIQHPETKYRLKILDHLGIYILIAGTYTPFLLLCIKGTLGWICFGLIWLIAIGGSVYKLTAKNKDSKVSLIIYLAMGWLVIFIAKPMIDTVPSLSLLLIVAGGLSYTVGTYFYAQKKKMYFHAIWHIFVMLGSLSHFLAVAVVVSSGAS